MGSLLREGSQKKIPLPSPNSCPDFQFAAPNPSFALITNISTLTKDKKISNDLQFFSKDNVAMLVGRRRGDVHFGLPTHAAEIFFSLVEEFPTAATEGRSHGGRKTHLPEEEGEEEFGLLHRPSRGSGNSQANRHGRSSQFLCTVPHNCLPGPYAHVLFLGTLSLRPLPPPLPKVVSPPKHIAFSHISLSPLFSSPLSSALLKRRGIGVCVRVELRSLSTGWFGF